jgi:hypothetical protein
MKTARWVGLLIALITAATAVGGEAEAPAGSSPPDSDVSGGSGGLREEVARLRALVEEKTKRISALEAENAALRARLGEKPATPAAGESAPEAKSLPPLRVQELVAAARAYLAAPANETQAARQIRQKKILDGLTGRELVMAAKLVDIKPAKGPNEFRAEFRQKTSPSETVILRFASTDDSLVALAVGEEKTVRLKVTGLSFGITYKQAQGESIGQWEPGPARARNATGTAFIVEGTDARLAP